MSGYTEEYEPEGEDKSYQGWKHLIPFRSDSKNPKTLPLITAGPLSYATGVWLNKLIFQSNKNELTQDDLYDTPWRDSASCNMNMFERIWDEEVSRYGKEKSSVVRAIYKLIRPRFFVAAFLIIFLSLYAVIGPAYFLQTLLKLNEDPETGVGIKILYIICLAVWTNGATQLQNVIFSVGNLAGTRVRGGVFSAVFKKILSQRIQSKSAGELINLCAVDGQRLYLAILYGIFGLGCVGAVFGGLYSVYLLGPWGSSGFVFFLAFLPLPVLMAKVIFNIKGRSIPITEHRVKLMSEIITAIKLVKMYAWEKSFARKIEEIRTKEESLIKKVLTVKSILGIIPQLIVVMGSIVTIMLITLTGNSITYTQVFVFLPLLNCLRFSIAMMPLSIMCIAEAYHACSRIKEILIAESTTFEVLPIRDSGNLIEIRNGYFGWSSKVKPDSDKPLTERTKKRKKRNYPDYKESTEEESQLLVKDSVDLPDEHTIVTLHNISLSVKEGALLGICGAVGSGKTSIIQTILRMTKKEGGTFAMNKDKQIAYVAQQAWIMNATVRQNILFGQRFNQQWYEEVIEACALLSDFNQLTAGDQTEVGERGINLSGGQKQRISMARAVYSNSDIVLLDDPLSAVDAHVGQHIFTNCIKGLLKDKTVVFVTHQLQFLTDCDYILVMKDGCIVEEGDHRLLMSNINGEYANLIKSFHDDGETHDGGDAGTETSQQNEYEEKLKQIPNQEITADKDDDFDKRKNSSSKNVKEDYKRLEFEPSGKLTKMEDSRSDKVKMATYRSYIQAAGGFCVFIVVLLLILITLSAQSFTNYWLSVWLKAGSGGVLVNVTYLVNQSEVVRQEVSMDILDNPKLSLYQLVYGLTLPAIIILTVIKSQSYVQAAMKASSNMHDKLFRKLVASPMKFFDVTPCGQILNRFSKDMDEMDSLLPFMSEQFLNNAGIFLVTAAVIASVFPFFLIVMVMATGAFILFYRLSQNGIQSLKRIENVTRSPLFSHIAATVQGLDTIRAYKKEDNFHSQFNKLQDCNNMAFFLFETSMRWTGGILDLIAIMVIVATAVFASFSSSDIVSPSLAAMALTSALSMTDLFQYTVRVTVETAAKFTSVQRIQNYINNLDSEAPPIIEERRPDRAWPKHGAIKFSNVDLRYREGLPLVLKNITLDIKSQEKIGIVGRTGSGKSSTALALFRIIELAGGSITIDNIDISTIGLEDLRSKLSIIPQDPVLFVGTVRYNLDPFDKYTDKELWTVLSKCHVKHTIQALNGQLDAFIVENGENFSVGERQLLCMARALLRHSKILVLDEATAAIDTETDSLIQETIKEAFADCTMLTIAHRLNTVASYDRILVLDNGEIIEFDTPQKLLANKQSVFSQMMAVQESQKKSAIEE